MNLIQKIRAIAPAAAEQATLHAKTINPIYGLTLEAKLVKLRELGEVSLSASSKFAPNCWWCRIEISARGTTIKVISEWVGSPLEAVDDLIDKMLAAGLPL